MNDGYLASSEGPNTTPDHLARKRGKQNAMRYSRRLRTTLGPSVQAASVFSFVLHGEPVTPLSINEYVARLQEDATNTGEEREIKKAKVTANVLTALSTLSTDPEEVLDRRLIMECLRDAWLGVKAGPVPTLLQEPTVDSNAGNKDDPNHDENESSQNELDQITGNIVDSTNDGLNYKDVDEGEGNESHGEQGESEPV